MDLSPQMVSAPQEQKVATRTPTQNLREKLMYYKLVSLQLKTVRSCGTVAIILMSEPEGTEFTDT